MILPLTDLNHIFFIGIAGSGMSGIAQYLAALGIAVSGSDRYFIPGTTNEIRLKLEAEGIKCFSQDGEGITDETDLVVVSTAVEDTVAEVQKAKALSIPVIRRSELLAMISKTKKTIAIGGTSGKSTTSAMLYDIMETAGIKPDIITGAGLVSIMKRGKIGNAILGKGEWLIIEADESDGSIVQYHPEIGVLLNIDKDHQEIEELLDIFGQFKNNTNGIFIVNQFNELAKQLSQNAAQDFSISGESTAGYVANDFKQQGLEIHFTIQDVPFKLNTVGRHNMENALAAVAVANQCGIGLEVCSAALKKYEGIYRRHEVLGKKNGIYVIDDYAHNPVKCAASIYACQDIAPKLVAWFQPHGYGPTRFLKNEFIQEIATALRPEDEIWMSEIFYAGGTAARDISANDLILGIQTLGKKAFFVEDRNDFLEEVRPHLTKDCVLLLMGARDPGLEIFSRQVWNNL